MGTIKVDELLNRVEKLAEVQGGSLPMGHVYVWFSTDGKGPALFQTGKMNPLDANYRILAMFQNEHEVRIYSFLVKEPPTNESKLPKRHTLAKNSPTVYCELMPHGTFVAEWADELSSLDVATASVVEDKLISGDDDGDDPDPEPEPEPEPEPLTATPTAE